MIVRTSTDVFDTGCDQIDVTSLNRPDTNWRTLDAQGHEHRWYTDGKPADGDYDCTKKYETPTLIWVKDGEEYWEDDDEPHNVGHRECRDCGEHIQPGYTADTNRQYIAGLRWYRINGDPVSPEEFTRRFNEQHPTTPI